MKEFVGLADVITPNLTEACLLLGKKYPKKPVTESEITEILYALSELGPQKIAVTSVMTDTNKMCTCVLDKTVNKTAFLDCGYVNRPFHGTGDIFAAVLTGGLLRGKSMLNASALAVDFIKEAISETMKYPDIKIEHGSIFEPIMAGFFDKRF